MPLTPGTRLGVYEITALLGAGGMGEVYRATDTNLKRSVAINVLPKAVATDAALLTRLQREAERLPAGTPPALRTLIERCLERGPKLRLRDVGEARIALQSPESPIPRTP